jgi:hypothetical protein
MVLRRTSTIRIVSQLLLSGSQFDQTTCGSDYYYYFGVVKLQTMTESRLYWLDCISTGLHPLLVWIVLLSNTSRVLFHFTATSHVYLYCYVARLSLPLRREPISTATSHVYLYCSSRDNHPSRISIA